MKESQIHPVPQSQQELCLLAGKGRSRHAVPVDAKEGLVMPNMATGLGRSWATVQEAGSPWPQQCMEATTKHREQAKRP